MPLPAHRETLDLVRQAIVKDDTSVLTEHALKLHEQLQELLAELLSGEHTTRSLVQWAQDKFGVGRATAHARIRDVKDLFADLLPTSRALDAHLLAMRCEALMDDAKAVDDVAERIRLQKDLLRELVRIKGLDRGEGAEMDASLVEPHEYHLKVPRSIARLVRGLLASGVVDIPAPDIPEAEVLEETTAEK